MVQETSLDTNHGTVLFSHSQDWMPGSGQSSTVIRGVLISSICHSVHAIKALRRSHEVLRYSPSRGASPSQLSCGMGKALRTIPPGAKKNYTRLCVTSMTAPRLKGARWLSCCCFSIITVRAAIFSGAAKRTAPVTMTVPTAACSALSRCAPRHWVVNNRR
jgi:hypothetical protein